MNADDLPDRTIWVKPDDQTVIQIIDQTKLPHELSIKDLRNVDDFVTAIKDMYVRGAGLIGATAGYGTYIATLEAKTQPSFDEFMNSAAILLKDARPTAINLAHAVDRVMKAIDSTSPIDDKVNAAFDMANEIADEDAQYGKLIGEYGLPIIQDVADSKEGPVFVLTHCNAGELAFVYRGSATGPIYEAHEKGIDLKVFVSETRPRNQGASLTVWELSRHGVPHELIADNAAGSLMQQGKVDVVIVGADRVARNGDAANKIGTLMKAIVAHEYNIPFYVALPSTTFDLSVASGDQIPIEERSEDEVKYIQGLDSSGKLSTVLLTPIDTPAYNPAFDITPAKYITGLITDRGVIQATEKDILRVFRDLPGA